MTPSPDLDPQTRQPGLGAGPTKTLRVAAVGDLHVGEAHVHDFETDTGVHRVHLVVARGHGRGRHGELGRGRNGATRMQGDEAQGHGRSRSPPQMLELNRHVKS